MWPSSMVESVCEVLADTSTGLTGGEIGRLLAKVRVPDVDPDTVSYTHLTLPTNSRV